MIAKVVGLTGGIGSGKSQARRYFEELGVMALDADVIAREIHQDPHHPVIAQIAHRFGAVITQDGKMDRLKIRELLRTDPSANRDLKNLLGPHVIDALYEQSRLASGNYVVWESALIIEEHIKVDRILVIDCPVNTQTARVRLRNPDWSTEHIMHMLSLQLSREQRLSACDDSIVNDSTQEALKNAVLKQHQQYQTMWGEE